MSIADIQARIAQLERAHQRAVQQRRRSLEGAERNLLVGKATTADFQIIYAARLPTITQRLEEERQRLIEHPFVPPEPSYDMSAYRAFWLIIGALPNEIPTSALFCIRPNVTDGPRTPRSGTWYHKYVEANLVFIHLERWEAQNDPHRSGQNWTRADIIAFRHLD